MTSPRPETIEREKTPAHREPVGHAMAYRVPQVCAMLGISRATFYRRVESGEIVIRKLGSVSLVTRESLERLIETLAEARIETC